MQKIPVRIKENSWIALLAAKYLKATSVAIVFGKTIYLYGVSKKAFLQNTTWVRHEIAHILQYQQLGFVKFLIFYLFSNVKNGYINNKFEIEATQKEKDESILEKVTFV